MPEEIKTLRALFNELAHKPTPARFHKYCERLMIRVEAQDNEIEKLKKDLMEQAEKLTAITPEQMAKVPPTGQQVEAAGATCLAVAP